MKTDFKMYSLTGIGNCDFFKKIQEVPRVIVQKGKVLDFYSDFMASLGFVTNKTEFLNDMVVIRCRFKEDGTRCFSKDLFLKHRDRINGKRLFLGLESIDN